MRRIDLTGRRFGRFIVLAEVGRDQHKQRVWLCLCDCGKHFTRTGSNILAVERGTAVGTGCLDCAYRATGCARTVHGDTPRGARYPSLYLRWAHMKARCSNPKHHAWRYYGGKGIRVCAEWLVYANFKAWALANGFAAHLTIDRIDAAGNYEPANCRWVTNVENIQSMHAARGHRVKR